MAKPDDLRYGPPGETAVHVCVDMQRMFAEATDWHVPWFDRILPNVEAIVAAQPGRTIFTRFVPAQEPQDATGMWRHYYRRWAHMTIGALGSDLVEVVPSLARYIPPARVFDKLVYSPWIGTRLHLQLREAGIDTVIITGGETDVCVLTTVLGAVDWGFRTILVTDALCGSADQTHDAMMEVYCSRFGEQVETVSTERLIASWNVPAG